MRLSVRSLLSVSIFASSVSMRPLSRHQIAPRLPKTTTNGAISVQFTSPGYTGVARGSSQPSERDEATHPGPSTSSGQLRTGGAFLSPERRGWRRRIERGQKSPTRRPGSRRSSLLYHFFRYISLLRIEDFVERFVQSRTEIMEERPASISRNRFSAIFRSAMSSFALSDSTPLRRAWSPLPFKHTQCGHAFHTVRFFVGHWYPPSLFVSR